MEVREALSIVRRFQYRPPVNVAELANALGAKVYIFSGWPESVSGKVYKDNKEGGDRGFVIGVNKDHSSTRQRFTIAHEIAHIILHEVFIGHKDVIVDDILYRSSLSNPLETAANRMAADILMPWPLVKAEIEQGMDDVNALARRFRVSPAAMSIRLGITQD